MSDSLATLWTEARQAPLSMGFPRQDTGVVAISLSVCVCVCVCVCVYIDGTLLSHKKNKIMPFVAMRMELEKSEKDKYHMTSFMRI